ncbi:hypothetical protein LIER_17527 [Lithospermum erythrorhizon]|uniref:Uncharacterized protein n=1 Tax=Lithospermum erythrorhizon TaxID=34254 RepID=A0AAV3QAW7_LITER
MQGHGEFILRKGGEGMGVHLVLRRPGQSAIISVEMKGPVEFILPKGGEGMGVRPVLSRTGESTMGLRGTARRRRRLRGQGVAWKGVEDSLPAKALREEEI